MAVNPLFHTYKTRPLLTSNNNNRASMAHRSGAKRDGGSSDGNHQSKKRRLDQPEADESGDWDDLEFTQQDLENLDVIASQAIEGGTTSRQAAASEADQTLDFGSVSRHDTGLDQTGVFQAPAAGAPGRLKCRSSISSSSDSSGYPLSSASFRKTASSEISSAAGSLTSSRSSDEHSGHGGRGTSPGSTSTAQNGTTGNIVTVTALREDLRKKDAEIQKAQTELYAKDGEMKYLRDSVHRQEQELEKLRADREQRKEAEEQRGREREKELKQEVERLQTQMQFKSQDFQQLQQRCRTLETKLAQQQTASPSEPQPSTSTGGLTVSQTSGSPSKSPKVRKVEPRGSRTPEKGAFPSHHSFMSPVVEKQGSLSVGTMTGGELLPGEPSAGGVRMREARRARLRLRVSCSGGKMSGPQLVSQLLNCSCSHSGEVEDTGIVGLLQMLPSRHDLMGLKYQRDSSTSRLSPVKIPRRHSITPGSQFPKQSPPGSRPPSIVDRNHFLMAVQGLQQLNNSLQPSRLDKSLSSHLQKTSPIHHPQLVSALHSNYELRGGTSSSHLSPGDNTLPSEHKPPGTSSRSHAPPNSSTPHTHPPTISTPSHPRPPNSDSSSPSQPSGAVLLLPLLNDYLQHYVDMISGNEVQPTSPNISSSSTKSSSVEAGSSLESLTSSLGLLLQQGEEYANNVETLTLCALRVLNTLVCTCEGVRCVLVTSRLGTPVFHATTDTSSSTIGTDHDNEKVNESGMEGDDERSTTSSKGSSFAVSPTESPAVSLHGLNMLNKLLRLAAPSQASSGYKVPIVEAALDVLTSLSLSLPDRLVERLQSIVLHGVLSDCLQLDHQPGITVRALDLFSSLVRSPSILPFLCTKSDSCTLLNIHDVSTRLLATCRGKETLQPLLLNIISKVMSAVTHVVSYHRNGVYVLTDNNCRCSAQIIPSVVHPMFYLLRDYQLSHSDHILQVLRKGVLLLHAISVRDPNFQQRHNTVQSYYSTLMSGLTRVYKTCTDIPQEEVGALEDLWEELDESDTCSQDSDREDAIVID